MRIVTIVFVSVALAGCGVELLTTTAIQAELQAQNASAAKRQLGYASSTMGKINLRKAIDTYNAATGSYPPNLEALVPNYLPRLPLKPDGDPYYYDAKTGRLSDRPPAPEVAAVTQEDIRNKALIEEAVRNYGRATRYYPANLQTLVQSQWLSSVPKTSSGEEFLFNPQTGQVQHPSERGSAQAALRQTPRNGIRTPGAGAGPLGEVTTGIAIRNRLGNMNNAGVSAAGTGARLGVNGIAGQYNQRQQKALDEFLP